MQTEWSPLPGGRSKPRPLGVDSLLHHAESCQEGFIHYHIK